jgi:hypothetical protein
MAERPDPLAPPPGYAEVERGTLDDGKPYSVAVPVRGWDTVCDVRDDLTQKRCEHERGWVFTFGDLQEHVVTVDVCGHHRARVISDRDTAWCKICRELGDPDRMHMIRMQRVREDGTLADAELPPTSTHDVIEANRRLP